MKNLNIVLPLAAAAALALGCATDQRDAAAPAPAAKHVVLIGVDGFGAQWIPWDKMPNLRQLRDDGLYAVGRCGFPTASAINWACALFGTTVELHGYRNWNSRKPDVPAVETLPNGLPPCVFHEIRRQDPAAYTVSLYTWDGVGFCHNTNEVGFVRAYPGPGREAYPPRDAAVFDEGVNQTALRPKLMFLYQGQVDSWGGHGNGWGSPEYTNACANVDANIGRLVAALKTNGLWNDTIVMLVADHGGEGKKHGMAQLNCFEIPFLVSGPAAKGLRLREPVILADTAPTILSLLGYDVPETMRGRPAAVRAP